MCSGLIPSSISSCDATRSWSCKSRHDMIIRRCQDKTMWKQTDKRPREKVDFTPSSPFRREIWGSPNNHDHTKRDRIPRHLTTSRQRSVKNADWKFKGLFGQDKHQKKKRNREEIWRTWNALIGIAAVLQQEEKIRVFEAEKEKTRRRSLGRR